MYGVKGALWEEERFLNVTREAVPHDNHTWRLYFHISSLPILTNFDVPSASQYNFRQCKCFVFLKSVIQPFHIDLLLSGNMVKLV